MDVPSSGGGNGHDLKLAWGNKSLSARGGAAILLLCVALIVAANLYAGYRVEQAVSRHDTDTAAARQRQWEAMMRDSEQWRSSVLQMRRSMNRQTCITLFDFNERKYFRNPPEGVDPWKRVCPWIED